jgi:HSP20 family protein
VAKEDIQVNVTDHLLTIKGEKKREEETKEKNFYCSERSYGSFSRSVELPAEVHGEKARASFKNGVLELHLPKTEEAMKKEVKVKVE